MTTTAMTAATTFDWCSAVQWAAFSAASMVTLLKRSCFSWCRVSARTGSFSPKDKMTIIQFNSHFHSVKAKRSDAIARCPGLALWVRCALASRTWNTPANNAEPRRGWAPYCPQCRAPQIACRWRLRKPQQPEFRVGRPYFRIFSIQAFGGEQRNCGAMDRESARGLRSRPACWAFSWNAGSILALVVAAHWRCFFTVAIVAAASSALAARIEERRSCGGRHSGRFFSPSGFRISPPAGIHRFGDAVCASVGPTLRFPTFKPASGACSLRRG